jgi:hypothetical protein
MSGIINAVGSKSGVIGTTASGLVDVVKLTDTSMANSDTLSFVFAFVPSEIHLVSIGKSKHDTSNEQGYTTCDALITVTGIDTVSVALDQTTLVNNTAAVLSPESSFGITSGDSVYLVGGYDGTDWCTIEANTTWTTSTKTMLLTWENSANYTAGGCYCRLTATAYK